MCMSSFDFQNKAFLKYGFSLLHLGIKHLNESTYKHFFHIMLCFFMFWGNEVLFLFLFLFRVEKEFLFRVEKKQVEVQLHCKC